MKSIYELPKRIDIFIPWGYLIISFCFFYPYSILFPLIAIASLLTYKNRFLGGKNYICANISTLINTILISVAFLFTTLLPLILIDPIYNLYQERVVFSCWNLNRQSETDFLKKYHIWFKTNSSMDNLFKKIQVCHTTKAIPFLVYSSSHGLFSSNPFVIYHGLQGWEYFSLSNKIIHDFGIKSEDTDIILNSYFFKNKIDFSDRQYIKNKISYKNY